MRLTVYADYALRLPYGERWRKRVRRSRPGTVNLIGSGRDKAGEAGHTNAYAQAATPVTSAQVWKAWVRAARY